jgi:hypothetical protein
VAHAAISCWTFGSGPTGASARAEDGETSVPPPVTRRPHIGHANTSTSSVGTSGVRHRVHSRSAWSAGAARRVGPAIEAMPVGRYGPVRVTDGGVAEGGGAEGDRTGLGGADAAQGGLEPGRGTVGDGRVGGGAGVPQRIVPVRTS